MAEQVIVKDYNALFDPNVYLQTYYSTTSSQEELMMFIFRGMHDAFVDGHLHGQRLLDLGTGPNICSVISATPHFKEIYLSDFTDANRAFLRQWLKGTAEHSFQPFFEYFLKSEGKEQDWSIREAEVRSKVKAILKCDVLQPSIYEEAIGQFDVVTSSLCIEAVAEDVTCYEKICHKIGGLVKEGGHLVLDGVLEQTFYVVGGHRFYTLPITKEELLKSWKNAGFSVVKWKEEKAPPVEDNPFSDYSDAFVLVARKDVK